MNVFQLAGLLDTITTTADSKDCPGVCVHALATIICYDVLDDVACPSPSMKCCVDPPAPNGGDTVAYANSTATYEITTHASTTPTIVTTSKTPEPATVPSSTTTAQVAICSVFLLK